MGRSSTSSLQSRRLNPNDIRHPELAIVGEGVVAIGIDDEQGERPRLRFVSIPHINEVEPVSASVDTNS